MGVPVPQPERAPESSVVPVSASDEIFLTERRRGARKTLIGGRLITVRLGSDASGLALDLSESGMGLRAFPDLKVGNTTSLLFELPDLNARIEATGRVEWVERTGSLWSRGSGGRAGLRFVNLTDTARSILNQWMSADAPRVEPLKPVRPPALAPAWPEKSDGRAIMLVVGMRDQIHREGLSGLAALQWVAERVLRESNGSGVAVALDDGQGMVCRATLGNAPDLGVRIQSESGLSGECLRTGLIVRCDDTESDSRVDPVLCRELNLRCVLILPLFRGQSMCGVLEVFSEKPYAFPASVVSLLRRMCDLIVDIASGMLPELGGAPEPLRERSPRAGIVSESIPAAQQLASLIASSGSSDAGGSGAASISTGIVSSVSPDAPESPAAASDSRRRVKTASLADTIPCDVCGFANGRGQRTCSRCDVPLSVVENFLNAPNSEQLREAEAAALLARSRYGIGEPLTTPEPLAPETPQRNYKPLIGAATVLALASLGFGVWKGRQPATSATQTAPAVSSPAPQS
ncbi:MAG: GAF domain-containing protein, partial [Thermomicrobiales bacterium]